MPEIIKSLVGLSADPLRGVIRWLLAQAFDRECMDRHRLLAGAYLILTADLADNGAFLAGVADKEQGLPVFYRAVFDEMTEIELILLFRHVGSPPLCDLSSYRHVLPGA